MTLANPITWNNMCAEFGLTANTAVFPRDFYGKGGAPATGVLGFQDFVGRSNVTFNPAPSDIQLSDHTTSASVTITASQAVTWTWTPASGMSVNQSSGYVGTSVTVTANKLSANILTLTATLGGATYTWTIEGSG